VARYAARGVGGAEEGRSTVRAAADAIFASLAEMRPDLLPQWALVAVTLLLVLFTVRAMREQTTAMARTLRAEMLLRKSAQWDSDAMKAYRRKLAGCLRTMRAEDIPGHQIDPVLDFFEGLGIVVRSGYVDVEAVWHEFSDYAEHYWAACEGYVTTVREESDDPSYYSEFEFLARILRNHGNNRHRSFWRRLLQPRTARTPSADDVEDFLKAEERTE
jgi:hypothetical protein